MAIQKKAPKSEASKVTYNIEVTRAKELDNCIMFDMKANGVLIYGMCYRSGTSKEGKEYTLVSFPSRKGNDGKYYNHCWFKIDEDMIADIEKQIEALI